MLEILVGSTCTICVAKKEKRKKKDGDLPISMFLLHVVLTALYID